MLFIFCVVTLFSCGSKKKFSKVDSVENIKSTEQLHAELYKATRLLELLDVRIRLVETRDSSGNIRIETDVGIKKRTKANEQDSVKIFETWQDKKEKAVNQNTREEKAGVINSWARITGFVTIIIVVLSILYLAKRLKFKI